MTRRLSKEDILEGTKKQESLHLQDYDAEVVIRPLNDGELTKILELLGNIPLREDGTPDTTKIDLTKNLQALRLAASLGLAEPRLSLEEVGSMKFGVPEIIGTKVLELSGVAFNEGDLKKKKREIDRFARSPEGLELAALCLDLGYKLAETTKDLTRFQIGFLMASLTYRSELATQQRLAAEGVSRISVTEDEET